MVCHMKLAIAAALAATALLGAPVASADNIDDQFLSQLEQAGIIPGPNAISGAQQVCDLVWSGVSPYEVSNAVMQSNPMTWMQSKVMVALAIANYCPPAGSSYVA